MLVRFLLVSIAYVDNIVLLAPTPSAMRSFKFVTSMLRNVALTSVLRSLNASMVVAPRGTRRHRADERLFLLTCCILDFLYFVLEFSTAM